MGLKLEFKLRSRARIGTSHGLSRARGAQPRGKVLSFGRVGLGLGCRSGLIGRRRVLAHGRCLIRKRGVRRVFSLKRLASVFLKRLLRLLSGVILRESGCMGLLSVPESFD